MHVYIFGYGSLLNPKSRARTFTEGTVFESVYLHGFERVLNAATEKDKHVAMNIRRNPMKSTVGVLVAVPHNQLPVLQSREAGYEMIEITDCLSRNIGHPVFTFIMKNPVTENKVVSHAYLETCLGGLSETDRESWLFETIIEHEVVDDRNDPLCRYYIPIGK